MKRLPHVSSKRSYLMAFGSDPPPPPKPFHLKYPEIWAGRRLHDWIIFLIIMLNKDMPIDVVQRGLRKIFNISITRTEIWRHYYMFRKFFY